MSRRDPGPARPLALALAAAMAVALVLITPAGARTGQFTASRAARVTSRAWASGGTPAVGALFGVGRSGALAGHFCSASVVDSPAGDLVVTAAHCLAAHAAGQVVFVPGYAGGREPYGAWTVTRVITAPRWASDADPADDVAFLQVRQPKTGKAIERVTGAERLGIGLPPAQLVLVTGYPADGAAPVSCRNYTRPFGAIQLVFRCGGFAQGTSGSPMLTDVDPGTGLGTLIGVIGGYQQGGTTDSVSYAVRFGPAVAALYQQAIRPA